MSPLTPVGCTKAWPTPRTSRTEPAPKSSAWSRERLGSASPRGVARLAPTLIRERRRQVEPQPAPGLQGPQFGGIALQTSSDGHVRLVRSLLVRAVPAPERVAGVGAGRFCGSARSTSPPAWTRERAWCSRCRTWEAGISPARGTRARLQGQCGGRGAGAARAVRLVRHDARDPRHPRGATVATRRARCSRPCATTRPSACCGIAQTASRATSPVRSPRCRPPRDPPRSFAHTTGCYFMPNGHGEARIGPPIPVERTGSIHDDISRIARAGAPLRGDDPRAPEHWRTRCGPNWPSDHV